MQYLILTLTLVFANASCSSNQLVNKRGPFANPDNQSGSSEDEDFEEGREPTPITGRYLTYENGRVRGLFRKIKSKDYEITWKATVVDGQGSEYEPVAIEEKTIVSWGVPETLSGKIESLNCNPQTDLLSLVCRVKLKSENASIQVNLELTKSGQTRSEEARVDLPYAVGIAAGLVSTIPFRIVSDKQIEKNVALSESSNQIGFQNRPFEIDQIPKAQAGLGCTSKDRMFFASGHFIYYIDLNDNKVWLYAALKGKFSMTFFIAVFNPIKNTMTYANAGHPFPIMLNPGQKKPKSLVGSGDPLGVREDSTYKDKTIDVNVGDKLLCFTDGLIEAHDKKNGAWGRKKFFGALAGAIENNFTDALKYVLNQAVAHHGKEMKMDDVTFFVAEFAKSIKEEGDGENGESEKEPSHLRAINS